MFPQLRLESDSARDLLFNNNRSPVDAYESVKCFYVNFTLHHLTIHAICSFKSVSCKKMFHRPSRYLPKRNFSTVIIWNVGGCLVSWE